MSLLLALAAFPVFLHAAGTPTDALVQRLGRCLDGEERMITSCLDRTMDAAPPGIDTTDVLAAFMRGREEDPALEERCHPVAHAIGRWAMIRMGDVGTAFQSCDASCVSGCYHGVMQRFLAGVVEADDDHIDPLELADAFRDVCDPSRIGGSTVLLRFQCMHGLGHAALFVMDDLEQALHTCDLLRGKQERDWCHSGVFMEHVLGDTASGNIMESDPLSPCDDVAEEYRERCANEQSRVFALLGWNDDDVATACHRLTPYVGSCLQGFGRDVSTAWRGGDTRRVLEACALEKEMDREDCMRGVVTGLADATNDVRIPLEYCAALEDGRLRSECFGRAGAYAVNYHQRAAGEIMAACDELPEDVRADCRVRAAGEDRLGRWLWDVLGGIGAFVRGLWA